MDPVFIDRLLARDPRAIARALSIVVDESADAATLLASLYRRAGQAVVIGVTGPPGAGKSTLVDRLISATRQAGETVAVLAIDPSSPFSGGAMLDCKRGACDVCVSTAVDTCVTSDGRSAGSGAQESELADSDDGQVRYVSPSFVRTALEGRRHYMVFGGFSSTLRRLTLVALALGVVSVGSATTAWAQAAAPAAPADEFKFASDSGGMIWLVKPGSVADFDATWVSIRTKLAASDKAELKELGASLKIYKAVGANTEGQTYFFIIDPASKVLSYSVTYLLFESGLFTRPEADVMFPKLRDAITALNVLPLTKVQ